MCSLPSAPAAADEPTDPADEPAPAATGERLERLEREVAELRRELTALRTAPPAAPSGTAAEQGAELERRIDLLAEEIERLRLGSSAASADRVEHGLAPAASKVYRTERGVSLGGYGELVYHDLAGRGDGDPGGDDGGSTLDLERLVLYVGYRFDERFVFNSEIEIEHAKVEGDEGEVAVELAYLDFLWRPEANLRAGLVLVPMGLVNELHEPTVLLTARRPEVERRLLPSTWRENGLGLFGEAGALSYRTYVLAGLSAEGFSADEGLRGGRQEGAESSARDLAWVGRVDWAGVPGLRVGGSLFRGDSGQGLVTDGRRLRVGTTLGEAHLDWRRSGLRLRALVARAELDEVAALDRALGLAGVESIGSVQTGGYLEVGFDLLAGRGARSLTPYARWEWVDTQAAVPAGYAADPANDLEILTVGLAFQPVDRIVLKLDYQDFDDAGGDARDRVNAALGWSF